MAEYLTKAPRGVTEVARMTSARALGGGSPASKPWQLSFTLITVTRETILTDVRSFSWFD
jgi:hypothetical protein